VNQQSLAREQQGGIPGEFQEVFQLQQDAYSLNMNPSLAQRRDDLRALLALITENADALADAVNRDFGCRCRFETRLTEILLAQDAILAAIKSLKKWMKPQKRHLDSMQYPLASAWTFPQPVGVVGIVVPWNFPIGMAFQPLIGAFAAGNRVMIKMSENSNHLALLLKQLSLKYFPLDKLAFFEDGEGRGPAFTSLPFNHIFFTGSSATAKSVMANAARNLTPVTLELGGKSPCVVAPDFPIRTAAQRIMWAKMLNAGQICTNVDYLFLPEGKVEEFIQEARIWFNEHQPDINDGDYTAIIDQHSYDRIEATVTDAWDKGANIIDIYHGPAADVTFRIMPPRLMVGVRDDMEIMQREIFGPLLPILTYSSPQQVLDYVNSKPRPLAFYIFSNDQSLQRHYLNHTISGGVGINEAVVQAGIHDLPFGGSGNSGMGHYHGYEGFLTFSKLRPVFRQGPMRGLDFLLPPYKGWSSKLLDALLWLKR
jgi:coniferyl-aldehyde dehydrogenase